MNGRCGRSRSSVLKADVRLLPAPNPGNLPRPTSSRRSSPRPRDGACRGRCCRRGVLRRTGRWPPADWPATAQTAGARPFPGRGGRQPQRGFGCGQGQFGRLYAHIVQLDPKTGRPRGLHVTKHAGARERVSSTCVRPARSAARRLRNASRAAAAGMAKAAARAIASGSMMSRSRSHPVRVKVDLPHPFGPATTYSVGMAACAGAPGQPDSRAGRRITRSPSLVRAM